MLDTSIFGSASICVVGSINRDVKTAPLRCGNHLFDDGENSVPWIAETVGGGGANSAATGAALGARVAFQGKVGKDRLGYRLEHALKRRGVATYLRKDPGCSTGTSINLVFDTGRRHFLSCLPNNESLSLADLNLDALSGYKQLYRADVWLAPLMLESGNQRLFERAKQAGMSVSLDLNWDPQWGVAPDQEIQRRKECVRKLLPMVSLVHGNVKELNQFADSSELNATLEKLEKWGANAVVIHMGKQGAGYYRQGKLVVEKPIEARTPANTTGSGDVLSMCMMLLSERPEIPVAKQLRLANTVVCEFMEGRRPFIPSL